MTSNLQRRASRRLRLAVLLQCLPLIGAAGCVADGFTPRPIEPPLFFAMLLSLVCWGFGYLYTHRWVRFALAFIGAPILAFMLYSRIMAVPRADPTASYFGHYLGVMTSDALTDSASQIRDEKNRAILFGILVAVGVGTVIWDTARIAGRAAPTRSTAIRRADPR